MRDLIYITKGNHLNKASKYNNNSEGKVKDLHHGLDPEAAVEGVEANDGGRWTVDDAVEKPEMIEYHQTHT